MRHHHTHGTETTHKSLRKVALAGLALNVMLSVVKLISGIIGHSYALVADSFHSLSDCTSDIAVIFGLRFWTRPADSTHPHGHRRIETIITILIGLILFLAGARLSIESVQRLIGGIGRRPRIIALVVALVSVFLKEAMYRWAAAAGERHSSKAMVANAHHHRSDALSSLPVPFAVVIAYFFPHLVIADAVVALIVSLLIIYTAARIIWPAVKELIDTSAPKHERDAIQRLALAVEGVQGVHGLRTRYLGSGIAVDLHITVDGDMDVRGGHELSEKVKGRLISDGPRVVDVVVHLEPCSDGRSGV